MVRKTEEQVRQGYIDEGWGKLAEFLGLDPYHTEPSARHILRQLWDKVGPRLVKDLEPPTNRYCFVATYCDMENADCLIDATTLEEAWLLFRDWCRHVFGENDGIVVDMIYQLPPLSEKPKFLEWGEKDGCNLLFKRDR